MRENPIGWTVSMTTHSERQRRTFISGNVTVIAEWNGRVAYFTPTVYFGQLPEDGRSRDAVERDVTVHMSYALREATNWIESVWRPLIANPPIGQVMRGDRYASDGAARHPLSCRCRECEPDYS